MEKGGERWKRVEGGRGRWRKKVEEEGGGSEKCAVRERAIESSLGIPSPY